jgi:Zn-dependent protease
VVEFRLGTIPIRVQGSFFIMALILGATGSRDPATVVIWIVVVALSVLLHELGHAMMGKAFGLVPAIELHGMGGTTSWPQGKDVSYGKRILISLAGPGVGLAIGVAIFGALVVAGKPENHLALVALEDLVYVNGFWAVLNLIPMLPLDGGNVMAHTLNAVTKGKGDRPARIVSLVVAAGVGLFALANQYAYGAILCALFAFQNGRMLVLASRLEKEAPLRQAMEQAVRELHGGDARASIALAERIVEEATSPELRLEAMRILAYAYVADGRWSQLMQLLQGAGLGRALADDDLARFEDAARGSGSITTGDAIAEMRAARAQSASDAG